ncbi:MAG: CehA/McbA family metallohydrolase [Candidatus Bathyarchaeia archaeon]
MKMAFNNPFEMDGRWFKGNLHAHTTNSDGDVPTEQLVKEYQEAGYDFLSITDHGKLTKIQGLSTPRFLLIPGEEISAGASEEGRFYHIVGVDIGGKIPVKDFDRDEDPQRVIELIRGLGGLALIAHPYWSSLNYSDLARLEGYIGVEVYNTNCELTIGRGRSTVHWDNLLSMGHRCLGFAVDDAHGRERPYLPSDICGAWINVRADRLTPESIWGAICRGLFYSSNGPEIYAIEIEGDEIRVASSPARSIGFISNAALGEKNTAEEGVIEEAVYRLMGGERYVRVEVIDQKGRTAWSNPIFIEI